ncbi:class I SAM-dependent methyltransferase [Mucilaginibacter jinjuensis]|uniref:Class I SAM-dependent methyltransferase n=1 Tax=Mucilaginibacter jinjuensis TaxID=1176721 RepID=A0ABY7TES5_9SPHI|nr:class I SAM-dependent methyltransferase [Mucilaginibacter jinjuensis]WCT14816.1 class I SAM-dependent methyltransferase [Mucilaginibacter jinjuensis]
MEITNPAFNYDKYGKQYSGQRRTDPHIATFINEALGDAKTVLNIGAGAGSYEPEDRYVIAVEPSIAMRAQRINNHKIPAIIATADNLPFDDKAFDATMAIVTVHHWPDIRKGLQELRRVTKHRVIVMTFDPDSLGNFWNAEYFPEVIEVERQRYPTIDFLMEAMGGKTLVEAVSVPLNCVDGFQEAYYGRPEAFLSKEVRKAQSAWGFIAEDEQERIVKRLADDLESGAWDAKFGHYRTQPTFTCALRLIIADYD